MDTATHNTSITSHARTSEHSGSDWHLHIRLKVCVYQYSQSWRYWDWAMAGQFLDPWRARPLKLSLVNVSMGCKAVDRFRILNGCKGSHVDSWHSRTHGVVWRPHPTTKVLMGPGKIQPFSSDLAWVYSDGSFDVRTHSTRIRFHTVADICEPFSI